MAEFHYSASDWDRLRETYPYLDTSGPGPMGYSDSTAFSSPESTYPDEQLIEGPYYSQPRRNGPMEHKPIPYRPGPYTPSPHQPIQHQAIRYGPVEKPLSAQTRPSPFERGAIEFNRKAEGLNTNRHLVAYEQTLLKTCFIFHAGGKYEWFDDHTKRFVRKIQIVVRHLDEGDIFADGNSMLMHLGELMSQLQPLPGLEYLDVHFLDANVSLVTSFLAMTVRHRLFPNTLSNPLIVVTRRGPDHAGSAHFHLDRKSLDVLDVAKALDSDSKHRALYPTSNSYFDILIGTFSMPEAISLEVLACSINKPKEHFIAPDGPTNFWVMFANHIRQNLVLPCDKVNPALLEWITKANPLYKLCKAVRKELSNQSNVPTPSGFSHLPPVPIPAKRKRYDAHPVAGERQGPTVIDLTKDFDACAERTPRQGTASTSPFTANPCGVTSASIAQAPLQSAVDLIKNGEDTRTQRENVRAITMHSMPVLRTDSGQVRGSKDLDGSLAANISSPLDPDSQTHRRLKSYSVPNVPTPDANNNSSPMLSPGKCGSSRRPIPQRSRHIDKSPDGAKDSFTPTPSPKLLDNTRVSGIANGGLPTPALNEITEDIENLIEQGFDDAGLFYNSPFITGQNPLDEIFLPFPFPSSCDLEPIFNFGADVPTHDFDFSGEANAMNQYPVYSQGPCSTVNPQELETDPVAVPDPDAFLVTNFTCGYDTISLSATHPAKRQRSIQLAYAVDVSNPPDRDLEPPARRPRGRPRKHPVGSRPNKKSAGKPRGDIQLTSPSTSTSSR